MDQSVTKKDNFWHLTKAKTPEEIVNFADIALKHKLYVSGWMLSGHLLIVRDTPSTARSIVIAYDREEPIGIAILFANRYIEPYQPPKSSYYQHESSGGYANAFVRKSYRRQGIGKNMMEHLMQDYDYFTSDYGVIGSEKFWALVREQHENNKKSLTQVA